VGKELGEAQQKIAILQEKTVDFSSVKQAVRDVLLLNYEVMKKAIFMESTMPEIEKKDKKGVVKKINQLIYGKNNVDWDKFYFVINNLNDGFYDKVRKQYPMLSEKEFKVACLSCEDDFNDNEIGVIMGTSSSMVRKIRSGFRQKSGIESYENIRDFLSKAIFSEG
jgi:hypothetical protein